MSDPSLPGRRGTERSEGRVLSKTEKGWLTVGAVGAGGGLVLLEVLGVWTPEQWSASAAVATVIVAVIAALVALRQLREAQTLRLQQERDALALRREQAQPYVAIFMAPLVAVDPKFQELVIKNFGATAAFNVRVESQPTIEREWEGEAQKVPLPEIPTLVPCQEWRAVWDFFPSRHEAGLPDRHDVRVLFQDSHGESYTLDYTLDWAVNRDRLSVKTFSVHHGVKELKAIRERLDQG